jgi:MFS family permease
MLPHSPPISELTSRQIGWIGGGYLSMLGTMAGQTVFISLFGGVIRNEFSMSAGEYGLVYTLATLCSAVVLVFLGPLADSYSPRTVGILSVVGLSASALLMSTATSTGVLLIALFGLRLCGQGMLSHNCATALTRWFKRFRGRALAISQFGYSTGEATLPVLVALGIAAWGWRSVWQVTAAVLILAFVPAIFLLFRDRPGDIPQFTTADNANKVQASPWDRRKVIGDSLFWLVLLGVLANPAIVTLIFFHQTDLIQTKDWDPVVFAASFPVLSVTSAICGMLGGTLIDRFGAWRLLPYVLLPLGLANVTLWLGSAEWTIALVFFLTGLSAGVVIGVVSVVWAELYGTTHLGSIRSVATAGLVLASAAGPGLAGILIDFGIPLERQCLFYAIYCAIASGGYLLLQPRLRLQVRANAAFA